MEDKQERKEKNPKNIVIPPKKPKLSKAERRALQEDQRAAKGKKPDGGDAPKSKEQNQPKGGAAGGGSGSGSGSSEDSSRIKVDAAGMVRDE